MNTKISLGFARREFASSLAIAVASPGVRPPDAVEHLLIQSLVRNLCDTTNFRILKSPSVILHPMYFKDRCANLSQLTRQGYETSHVALTFSTANKDTVESFEIDTVCLEMKPVNYGPAGPSFHRLRSKKLKTQTNHVLRLNHVVIPPGVFLDAVDAIKNMPPLEQPFIANPRPGPRTRGFEHGLEGFEFVSFDHLVTGDRHFCYCARFANESMLSTAKQKASSYARDGWPHQVVRLLSDAKYRDGVCHLCVARRSGPEAAAELYGDAVSEFIPAYTDQVMLTEGVDKPTARGDVQQTLGLSRWVREAEMYSLVKKVFPDRVVLREASPPWLGRQRLDVFVPDLHLAIEHQGEQHYRAVDAFGGESALQRNLERDALKRRLCKENKVHFIEIRFDEPLTLPSLRRRLRRFT